MKDFESIKKLSKERLKRANIIKKEGGIGPAVKSGHLNQFLDITVSEALILGLLNQGITKYIGIFGHGSTDIGEVLRVYEEAGLVKMFNVRHETEAAHIASALRWQYDEVSAVVTSIGPGALHAFAGSLVSASSGLGVYHIYADETTHDEGFNFQQVPKHESCLYLKMTDIMGKSYLLHTPEAIFTALRLGYATVHRQDFASPFYFLLPMNVQPKSIINFNLLELPGRTIMNPVVCDSQDQFDKARELIKKSKKIVIKTGRGAIGAGDEIKILSYLIDAVVVNGANVPGLLPYSEKRNTTVGGSKGSICGNYAMNEADLVVVVGSRAVCSWDSSGTAWRNAKGFINFNTNVYDATHYNNTITILGNAKGNLLKLINTLKSNGYKEQKENISPWLKKNIQKKEEWIEYKQKRYDNPVIFDPRWGREVLTYPASIKIACDFAAEVNAVKYFDAGDLQALGFQIVEDRFYGETYTDGGSSYMGFSVSALLANAIRNEGVYGIAFTGDGSFTMNPQILIDGIEHGLRAMIIIFDNRAMGGIVTLQRKQYGEVFKTYDSVEVDYVSWANSIKGVKGVFGGYTPKDFKKALKEGYNYQKISLIHLPVYMGDAELGELGSFGDWNVGVWCEEVQKIHHMLGH